MKFDRTTILGFVLLAALFFGYFYFTNQEQAKLKKQQAEDQRIKDSIALTVQPKIDTSLQGQKAVALNDTLLNKAAAGDFQSAKTAPEQLIYAENDVFKVAFTTRGGQPKWILLKKFKNQDSGLVKLAGTDYDRISYRVKAGNNTVETADLLFTKIDSAKTPEGIATYSFTAASTDSAASNSITHTFTLRKDDYMIDFGIAMRGAEKLLGGQTKLNMQWQYTASQQEPSLSYEKENTQVGYVEDGSFDYHTIAKTSDVEFDKKVKWVGIRQRFFFTIFVAKNEFSNGKMEWTIPSDTNIVVQSKTTLDVPVALDGKADFSLYYGPSDYHILKRYDMKFERLVNLGQGIYAFVRPLNKYVILPIFDIMKGFGSYGLAIALLTLFIRLVISPLTYSSYLSGARMKALRPEIALLKEKHGGDQQAMSMEQMKLFREAGVNPLGGCIPALLQIPIFFALFSFFNSEVGLRGADFLWSKDLSAFDDVIKFGVNIPLLGNHLSLFTITAVLTSFLISVYSMSMTPDQSNPVMKYLPYIFPIFLLFIFNRLPAGLTWYYTVSNIVTLVLQFVIQNYIIDHNKILAKIDANRKKPKTKSKWQERMEQMQEQQKKLKEMQQKNKKR